MGVLPVTGGRNHLTGDRLETHNGNEIFMWSQKTGLVLHAVMVKETPLKSALILQLTGGEYFGLHLIITFIFTKQKTLISFLFFLVVLVFLKEIIFNFSFSVLFFCDFSSVCCRFLLFF